MDGFEIPIGGDLSPLQSAIEGIIAAVEQMGEKISASLERGNAATLAAVAGMERMQSGSRAAAAAQQAAAGAASTASQKFMQAAQTAGNLGHAAAGIVGGLQAVNTASRALAGINLASRFTGWVSALGGFRSALTSIPGRLSALASNPAFRKILVGAIGAAVAIGGTVLAIKATRAAFNAVLGVAGGVFRGIVSGAKRAGAAIKGMFSGMSGGKGLLSPFTSLAGALGVGGAMFLALAQFKSGWKSAADFEQLQVRIEQFTGSTAKAKAILEEMAEFAVKTPFELPDINRSLSQLMGAGIKDGVTDIVKELGAVSKDGQQLTELADALAKGFAKGKFQTEELNKFLERGINLMPQFAAVTGLTGDALTKAVEKGLKFEDVREAIGRMSREGGQFYKMLERQSMTATGLLSTMADVWNELRRAFMQPVMESLKPVIQGITASLEGMIPKAKAFGEMLAGGILKAFALIKSGQSMELLKTGAVLAFETAVDVLRRGLRGAVAFLATALPPVMDGVFAKMKDPRFWEGLMNIFRSIGSQLASDIKSALPMADQAKVKELRDLGAVQGELGKLQIEMAGNVDVTEILKKAIMDASQAAANAVQGPVPAGVEAARVAFDALMNSVKKQTDELRSKAAIPPPPGQSGPAQAPIEDSLTKGMPQAITIASSLARIGLGGGGSMIFQPMVAQQVKTNAGIMKTNQLLSGINSTLQGGLTARYA